MGGTGPLVEHGRGVSSVEGMPQEGEGRVTPVYIDRICDDQRAKAMPTLSEKVRAMIEDLQVLAATATGPGAKEELEQLIKEWTAEAARLEAEEAAVRK